MIIRAKISILFAVVHLVLGQVSRESKYIFIYIYLVLTMYLGGQCHNLTPQEYKITDQSAWDVGGSMFVEIDISKYAANTLTRRAGVINDHSFLEISVDARGNGGRQIRLEPGRNFAPVSKSAVVGNAFQYDLDNDFTKQLSEELKISTKF